MFNRLYKWATVSVHYVQMLTKAVGYVRGPMTYFGGARLSGTTSVFRAQDKTETNKKKEKKNGHSKLNSIGGAEMAAAERMRPFLVDARATR